MTKICRDCGKVLPIEEFYKHSQMGDGHLNKCKECVKKRVGKHRELNIKAIREYDMARSHLVKRQENRTAITKRRRHAVEGYISCHNAIAKAIKNGTLVRSNTCQICGSQGRVEAHHNNYIETLKVLWLCPCCHRAFHNGKNEKSERIKTIVNILFEIKNDVCPEE